MKRLISAVLALSLLGTAAASAQPYGGGYDRGFQRDYRDNSYRGYDRDRDSWDRYQGGRWDDRDDYRRRNNDGALVGLGIGLFALGMIAASSQHHSDYRDSYRYGR
jgi:hypothetical protein